MTSRTITPSKVTISRLLVSSSGTLAAIFEEFRQVVKALFFRPALEPDQPFVIEKADQLSKKLVIIFWFGRIHLFLRFVVGFDFCFAFREPAVLPRVSGERRLTLFSRSNKQRLHSERLGSPRSSPLGFFLLGYLVRFGPVQPEMGPEPAACLPDSFISIVPDSDLGAIGREPAEAVHLLRRQFVAVDLEIAWQAPAAVYDREIGPAEGTAHFAVHAAVVELDGV